jgi:hypothetical protein
MATMKAEAISEQKRLVRGEYWLAARSRLRARDAVHHRAWNVLMIAGPSPAEEINCIRECMHLAHITVVDLDEGNVLAAIDAGADEAFVCDVGRLQSVTNATGFYTKTLPPPEIADKKFDVVSLDLTGPANEWLADVVGCYFRQMLTSKGAMMVTFSYGRDVVEAMNEEWDVLRSKAQQKWHENGNWRNPSYRDALAVLNDIPEPIAIRVWCALRTRCTDLESCIQYRGHYMPMVACLIAKNRPLLGTRFTALSPDDLQYALVNEDLNLGKLYATPVERILELRRSHAARKAVATRRAQIAPVVPVVPALDAAWAAASKEERAAWWDNRVRHHLRNHLIEKGWTPPVKALPAPAKMITANRRNGDGREQQD